MEPIYITIRDWTALTGIGRGKTYDLLSSGTLRAVKAGKRTLIDMATGRAYLASLPTATISPARQPKRMAA